MKGVKIPIVVIGQKNKKSKISILIFKTFFYRAFSPYVVSKAYYVFDPNLAIQANTYNAYNSFTQQAFPGGNQVPAHLFSDFESWEAGTHGWKKGGGYNELWMYGSLGGHFQPLDFFLSSKGKLHMESGTITFNTLDTSVSGDFINAAGFAARKTDANNNVIGNTIVYSFDSVYLTSNVTVNIIGNIPIAILSLSSIYIGIHYIALKLIFILNFTSLI